MKENYQKLARMLGETRVFQNVPLAKYSSFRIGGVADLFFRAKTLRELIDTVICAKSLNIPYFILGGGTNLLISDKGIRGLVVKNESGTIKLVRIRGSRSGRENISAQIHTVYLEAESGVAINRLVRFTLDQGWAGLEAFLGQPGTVGGAVYTNAHNIKMRTFFGDRIVEAKLLDAAGAVKKVSRSYFRFDYDQSIIQQTKELVLSVVLQLETGLKTNLWRKATEALEYRKKTQPSGVFSSGCIFRNIERSEAIRLVTPNYTCSAGYLLERVGLKGVSWGGAYLSPHHSNFIINRGNAKAKDVLELIKLAKERVKERFNINLVEEIAIVGES